MGPAEWQSYTALSADITRDLAEQAYTTVAQATMLARTEASFISIYDKWSWEHRTVYGLCRRWPLTLIIDPSLIIDL